MDTPGPGSASSAVTTKRVQRTGIAGPTVFRGGRAYPAHPIRDPQARLQRHHPQSHHLATVVGYLRDCCRRVDIHANTFHLTDLDELDAVFSEDKIIENLRITAVDPHDGELSLVMQLGYIDIEASNASWAPAFNMIVRLLEGVPKNGTPLCGSPCVAPPSARARPPCPWSPPRPSCRRQRPRPLRWRWRR